MSSRDYENHPAWRNLPDNARPPKLERFCSLCATLLLLDFLALEFMSDWFLFFSAFPVILGIPLLWSIATILALVRLAQWRRFGRRAAKPILICIVPIVLIALWGPLNVRFQLRRGELARIVASDPAPLSPTSNFVGSSEWRAMTSFGRYRIETRDDRTYWIFACNDDAFWQDHGYVYIPEGGKPSDLVTVVVNETDRCFAARGWYAIRGRRR